MSSRIRERVLQSPEPYQVSFDQYQSSTVHGSHGTLVLQTPNVVTSTCEGTSISETCEDVVTPGFRRIINSGGILNNPFRKQTRTVVGLTPGNYVHQYQKVNSTRCTTNGEYYTQVYKHTGQFVPAHPGFLDTEVASQALALKTAAKNLAVVQAHAGVDVSKIQALVTIAEARKSVDSMAQISRKAIRILRNVRKLNLRDLRGEISPQALSDAYMEARYAIRPLIIDANNVRNYVSHGQPRHVRDTSLGSAVQQGSWSDTLETDLSWLTKVTWNRTTEYTVSANAGVLYSADVSRLTAAGGDQLAETLWELTPFSFIADWIANTGDLIAAWTPNAGVCALASWVTCREDWKAQVSAQSVRSTASTIGWTTTSLSFSGCSALSQDLVLERTIDPPLPVLPDFTVNLDGYKLLDLGIILRGIFRK